MAEVILQTLDGTTTVVPTGVIDGMRAALRGTVHEPGDDGYDEARTIWNGMIDRRPGMVIRCAGTGDVMRGVSLAREYGLLLAVRSGGHNIAGSAVCDGGLLLDLTPMKSVRVDPANRTAWAEPGVTNGEFDKETQTFGLATPLGINATTGIAGLTLGGGFGWTTRAFGLTADNLVSADVVLASGERVRASESENPDLYWALRGGGGNFGVVTAFEYRLHPLGPQVLAGLIVHPFDRAKTLLQEYRAFVADSPDELTCWAILRQAPPLPFLPETVHGQEILVFGVCYAGPVEDGEKAVAPLRALGDPIADVIGPTPYTGWQAAFDPLLAPGARNYWKSHDLLSLEDGAIDVILDHAARLPSPECEILLPYLGGAMSRVAPEATPWPLRRPHFIMNVHGRWQDAADDGSCKGWVRSLFDALEPYSAGSVYVNFMPEDESDRVVKAYGDNFERLRRIKGRYDPSNLFRTNQNITPAPDIRAAQ